MIPKEFGEEVILKDLRGHLVLKVKAETITSREELIYCERIVPNPSGTIRTVYSICGMVFTREKYDALGNGERKKRGGVANDAKEVSITKQIQTITGLDFFNADFLDGVVIDVNAFSNFFPYPDAVGALVDAIASKA